MYIISYFISEFIVGFCKLAKQKNTWYIYIFLLCFLGFGAVLWSGKNGGRAPKGGGSRFISLFAKKSLLKFTRIKNLLIYVCIVKKSAGFSLGI